MSDLLNTALTGLNAAQRSLDVIGNNITNAFTEGYTRQVGELKSYPSTKTGPNFIGNGVEFSSLKRIYDNFIEINYRASISNTSGADVYAKYATLIDNTLANQHAGIPQALNELYSALQEIATDPSSIPARQMFISQAEILEARFLELNNQFVGANREINAQILETVNKFNDLGTGIAKVNAQIVASNSGGREGLPGELLDTRDSLVRELSTLVSVATIQQEDGSLNIFIGNGYGFVIGGAFASLTTTLNPSDPERYEFAVASGNSVQIISNTLSGGTSGGLLSVRDEIINAGRDGLGRLAISIASVINEQNSKGIDLNGNFGGNLFKDVNDVKVCLDRVKIEPDNSGDAQLMVTINSIARPNDDSVYIFGDDGNITAAGSLNALGLFDLSLNGIVIPAALAGNDLLSTTDNAGSSIAAAAAINSRTNAHRVTATVVPNTAYLGAFTAGTLGAGDFTLNGSQIIGAFASEDALLIGINARSTITGIVAEKDANNNISLIAQDGRNIQIQTGGGVAAANFEEFSLSGGALNRVKKGAIRLESDNSSIVVAGVHPNYAGLSAGTIPESSTSLTTDSYTVTYDGTLYTLIRDKDLEVLSTSTALDFNIDGFTLNLLSGTAQAGDIFHLYPTRFGALNFISLETNPDRLAMAAPIRIESDLNNQGKALVTFDRVTDYSGAVGAGAQLGNIFQNDKTLSPPVLIKFTSATTYRLYDISNGVPGNAIGPEQAYNPITHNPVFPLPGVTDTTAPGPNPTYSWDPGIRINMTGPAAEGDIFIVEYNTDAISDNRNALQLISTGKEKLIRNGSATFEEDYSQKVAEIGSKAQRMDINLEAFKIIERSNKDKRDGLSAVNLDEEAGELLRFEKMYSASAQIIVASKQIFEILIAVLSGR